MKILPHEWDEITPLYFRLRLEGMRSVQMQEYQNKWEQTRWLATILLSPHAKKGKEIKPQQLCLFPWEEKSSQDIIDIVTKNKHIFDKLHL